MDTSQGYIFYKWPLFYSPDGRTMRRKFSLLKATQPPLINVFYCIFRSLWSQNLEKYVKFCENSQSTNILPQIWLKVQILLPPPCPGIFVEYISLQGKDLT